MSTDSDQGTPATMECRVCQTDVPAGEFCGLCGDYLTPQRGNGPSWLRIRAYGAAPGEHLLLPSLASSLFPHLPHRSRMPFRVVLVLVLARAGDVRDTANAPGVDHRGGARVAAAVPAVHAGGRRAPRSTHPHSGSHRSVGYRARSGVGAADRRDGRPLIRSAAGRRHRGGPNSPGRARRPGRRPDRDAGASSGGPPAAAADPRVVGRLHDRRAGSLDLHRGRHADPAGAAIRDGDDFPRTAPSTHSSSRQASAGWRSR